MATFKINTRYTNGFTDLNAEGIEFLVLRKALKLEPDAGDTYITITQEYLKRPDLISFNAYGTPRLWWALYEFNNIQDPIFGLRIGQLFRIPALDRLLDAINSLNKV